MPPLRRHQLAWLSSEGWRELLARDWDVDVWRCLSHWSRHHLPMVVTRQAAPRATAQDPIQLGLPVPPRWGRRLVTAALRPSGLLWFSEFPLMREVLPDLPRDDRPALYRTDAALRGLGVRTRAYGSAGWQWVSGLSYLHERSDLDLILSVDDAPHADRAARVLQGCVANTRIDGELMFPDGSAVAWREWLGWRTGRQARVLVKRLDSVGLEPAAEREVDAWPCAA